MKRSIYLALYLIIWFFLIFFFPEIYRDLNNIKLDWILFILLLIIQPLILYSKILPNLITNKDTIKAISAASGFLAIPFVLLIANQDQKELDKYGIETKAVVTKIHRARLSKRNYGDVFNAEYIVNGNTYTTKNISIKRIDCKIGDTIIIDYSSKHPHLNSLTNY